MRLWERRTRDDDYRLSFAYGNFATLSNVKERDIERILDYRLSPLYVSVHATNHEARKVLLNNPRVPDIVDQDGGCAPGKGESPVGFRVRGGGDEAALGAILGDQEDGASGGRGAEDGRGSER